jgi:hypothetical protein
VSWRLTTELALGGGFGADPQPWKHDRASAWGNSAHFGISHVGTFGWYSLCRSTKMVRQQKVRITTTSERAKHYLGAPQPGLPVFLGRLRHVGHWRMPSPCVHCRGVSEIRRGPPCANMGCQYCCSAIGLVKYDGVRVRPDGLRSTGLRSTLIDVAQGECKYVLRSLHEPQLIDLQAHL